jgi:lipid II:glycine glycyltransferase (peptidoglycan interpeptide bridge formation enzyme)
MWQGLAPAMRRGIRKAGRDGVVVQPLTGLQAVEDFRGLHASVRKRKYRLLAQPAAFFGSIHDQFAPSGDWLPLGAYHQGRLIAATIYLRYGDTLYYKFNASAHDALELRPNNLLLWEGAKMAHQLGCHTLDLGPSDDNQPGLIRFKQDSGATASEVQFLRWVPDGWDDSRAAEVRRLLGQLTALLIEPSVPDDVSMRAGDLLYRYFA